MSGLPAFIIYPVTILVLTSPALSIHLPAYSARASDLSDWLPRSLDQTEFDQESAPHLNKSGIKAHRVQWNETQGTRNTPFKDVALFVHCRSSWEICELRSNVVNGWRPFFRTVLYVINHPNHHLSTPLPSWASAFCDGEIDPISCVAKAITDKSVASHAGLLYMHFDAIIDPCSLTSNFQPDQVGLFSSQRHAYERWNIHELDRCARYNPSHTDCLRTEQSPGSWSRSQYEAWPQIMAQVHKEFPSHQFSVRDDAAFNACHDLFYVPKAVFANYVTLANIFGKHKIWHEISGPTLLSLAADLQRGSLPQDLDCWGGYTVKVGASALADSYFRCAHPVSLDDDKAQRSISDIQGQTCASS